MPRPLTNPEMVLLQMETGYLDMGIELGGSAILGWEGRTILVYHSNSGAGYFTTDISDLPPERITALAKEYPVHGMLYYLPGAIVEVIQEKVEQAIDFAVGIGETAARVQQRVSDAVGNVAAQFSPQTVAQAAILPLALVVAGLFLIDRMKPKFS